MHEGSETHAPVEEPRWQTPVPPFYFVHVVPYARRVRTGGVPPDWATLCQDVVQISANALGAVRSGGVWIGPWGHMAPRSVSLAVAGEAPTALDSVTLEVKWEVMLARSW